MDTPEKRFSEAYDAYADAIFRHVYFRTSDRERALEITQEVFASFWKQLRENIEIEHTRAFLYRSAHNAFVNELRDRKRPVSLETLMETGFDILYDVADAEELATQKEAVERIRDIEEPYREVLILRYIDGLLVKEIAQLLGEKENTVSVRIKRGVEKLTKLYGTS